jgi:hypothetical protein
MQPDQCNEIWERIMNDRRFGGAGEDIAGLPEPREIVVERHWLRYVPMFVYLFVVYVCVKLFGFNVRTVLFSVGDYSLSAVEFFYAFAGVALVINALKVSHPMENNISECVGDLIAWLFFFAFLLLGTVHVRGLSMFSSTEFFVLTMMEGFGVVAGFIINARTYGRNIIETHH